MRSSVFQHDQKIVHKEYVFNTFKEKLNFIFSMSSLISKAEKQEGKKNNWAAERPQMAALSPPQKNSAGPS
jgi:hypothetical protein